MKTTVLFFSMLTFLTLNSFGQDKKIDGLPENTEDRAEIFKAIVNDHGLMMEFMQAIKGNEHAMMMMKGNPEMMRNMMDMCDQDSTMRSKMADMMTEHPEMMEMCMKKMKEKGMMGPDGKMKMMNSEGKTTGKEHNHQH